MAAGRYGSGQDLRFQVLFGGQAPAVADFALNQAEEELVQ
jgi:hypothetical protein